MIANKRFSKGLIVAFILLLPHTGWGQATPTPSYNLPERGTIVDWPNGNVTHYWDHGRSYQTFGNDNIIQRDDGHGHITRYGTMHDDTPVFDTLREIEQFNRYMNGD